MLNKSNTRNERGENLIELMVVLTIAILVVGSLVFAVISSLRNADFSKNQIQATKYAQEGIEALRAMRDRDGAIINFPPTGSQAGSISSWSDPDLWSNRVSAAGACGPCYFLLVDNQQGIQWSENSNGEDIKSEGKFFRYLIFDDEAAPSSYQSEKRVTIIVRWTDTSGSHESKLVTILGKL